MKFRYELIVGILIIIIVIGIMTTYGTCHCKKKRKSKCNKEMEGFDNTGGDVEEEEEEKKDNPAPTQSMDTESFVSINNASCNKCKWMSKGRGKNGKSSYICSCTEPFNTSMGPTMESFDNLSNFNNITFSNSNSSDSMLDFFKNVMFSTECCPSSYSTDRGCACISPDQYNVLKTRGSNNIPYSDL